MIPFAGSANPAPMYSRATLHEPGGTTKTAQFGNVLLNDVGEEFLMFSVCIAPGATATGDDPSQTCLETGR